MVRGSARAASDGAEVPSLLPVCGSDGRGPALPPPRAARPPCDALAAWRCGRTSVSCSPDFISCLPACFLPLILLFFFLSQKTANTEIETSVVRQIIACIWTFHFRVYTLYPKPACFMHRVGGGCVSKYHASFESFSSENAKSLFGPSVPSRPAVCTYSVAASRL